MFKFKFALKAVVTLAASLVFTCIAQAQMAQTFVSAQTGNDANDCSLGQPCRTFTRALVQVQASGQITALDSGDYAPFTITKAVTVQAAPGIHAGITATSGNAVAIAAGATDVIVLRGLTLNGLGAASFGINLNGGGQLQIEHCTVNAFTGTGIRLAPNSTGQHVISDTVVLNSNIGIVAGTAVAGSITMSVTVERCRVEKNSIGISFPANFTGNKVLATVRNSVATGNTQDGFVATANFGVAEMNLENCVAANNGTGIKSLTTPTTVRVSNCTITDNGTGVQSLNGALLSRLNNTVEGNTTNGVFTGTFTAK